MTYEIRPLTGADHDAWLNLRLEALDLYPQNFLTTADEVRARPVADNQAMLDQRAMRGIFTQSHLIGLAGFVPVPFKSTAHRVEIGTFYITPDYHGTGAADQLMTALIDEARARDHWQMELYVATTNPRGKRFYERHGFTVQGLLPNAALINGTMTSDHFMTRDLRG